MVVQRESLREQIRRVLVDRILSGEYPPGERLIELQLAKEFGASQGPVREALRELEAARLIESEPHRGSRVRAVSPQEMVDAYEARGALEAAAAIKAAVVFKNDASKLRAELKAMLRAATVNDRAEQAARNHVFHRLIVEASGNSVLLRLWDSLAFELRTRISLNHPDAVPVREAKSHEPIIDALEAGNGEAAAFLLREHSATFGKRFITTEEK